MYHYERCGFQIGDMVRFKDTYDGRVRLPTGQGRVEWIGNFTVGVDFGEDQIRVIRKEYLELCPVNVLSRSQRFNAERTYNAVVV